MGIRHKGRTDKEKANDITRRQEHSAAWRLVLLDVLLNPRCSKAISTDEQMRRAGVWIRSVFVEADFQRQIPLLPFHQAN